MFFKGCHICFKPIRNSAKDVHKFLFKLEEFANLQPKKLRTCLALKHAAVIDYISVPRFLSCFGRFSRIVTNFYHLAINYCMVQLFCFTVLQISPSTTSAYISTLFPRISANALYIKSALSGISAHNQATLSIMRTLK